MERLNYHLQLRGQQPRLTANVQRNGGYTFSPTDGLVGT